MVYLQITFFVNIFLFFTNIFMVFPFFYNKLKISLLLCLGLSVFAFVSSGNIMKLLAGFGDNIEFPLIILFVVLVFEVMGCFLAAPFGLKKRKRSGKPL